MGEWKRENLGGIDKAKIRKGDGLTSAKMVSGEYPVIAGGMDYCGTHNRFNRAENTITVSASGANAGTVLFHKTKIFATDCSTIEWDGSQTFLYYSLVRRQKEFTAMQSGLAQPHVYPKDIEKFVLHYPTSLDEQRRIADILTAADEAIATSRALVEKYAVVKLGLMRDLLGRGVPTRGWKTVPLGANNGIADVIMGHSPKGENINQDGKGVPFLQGNADFGVYSPIESFWSTQRTRLSAVGDMLISVRAPVGQINVSDKPYCIGRGLAAVRFTKVNSTFGIYAVQQAIHQLYIRSQGSTFEAISRDDLEEFELNIPTSIDEQRRIAKILTAADTRLTTERAHLQKLENIKRGLMDDLLTNRVSTNSILHKYRHRKGR